MRRIICWFSLLVFIAFVIAACGKPVIRIGPGSSLGDQSQKKIAVPRDAKPEQILAYEKEIEKYWAEMLVECKAAFSTLESTASTLRWTSFGIAMVGTVAGAIVAPALAVTAPTANAAWTAGFSGLSGATNTAQNVLKERDLTPEYNLKIRDEMRSKWDAALLEYYAADSPQKRVMALQKATAACVGYAIMNPAVEVTDKPAENKNK